jgi:hypothetical protein
MKKSQWLRDREREWKKQWLLEREARRTAQPLDDYWLIVYKIGRFWFQAGPKEGSVDEVWAWFRDVWGISPDYENIFFVALSQGECPPTFRR